MEKKIKNIRIIINPAAGIGESILPIINASMKEDSNNGYKYTWIFRQISLGY